MAKHLPLGSRYPVLHLSAAVVCGIAAAVMLALETVSEPFAERPMATFGLAAALLVLAVANVWEWRRKRGATSGA